MSVIGGAKLICRDPICTGPICAEICDQRGADGTRASVEASVVAEPVDIAW